MKLMDMVDQWTKNHTKGAIAQAVGCSGVTLNKKLTGASELTFGEAEKLAEILGINLSELAAAIHESTEVS